jgi:hypothetical protein
MIIATTEGVAGHRVVETKGEVFGLVVRSRSLGGNIAVGLRSVVGERSRSTPRCWRIRAGRPWTQKMRGFAGAVILPVGEYTRSEI